jgi:predicted nucleic acid-binding Zn ribbon protein
MAFFNEIGKKVSQAGQGAVQSTKNFAATAKLNSQIEDEERKIDDLYYQIGKAYFASHRDNPDESLAAYFTAVVNAQKTIDEYKEQVKQIKGVVNCPGCGAEVPYNVTFCNSCGTRMPVHRAPQPVQPENTVTCSVCGAFVPADFKFCSKCGSLMEKAPEPVAPTAPEVPVVPVETVRICPNCGKQLEDGAVFCTGCGQKV